MTLTKHRICVNVRLTPPRSARHPSPAKLERGMGALRCAPYAKTMICYVLRAIFGREHRCTLTGCAPDSSNV